MSRPTIFKVGNTVYWSIYTYTDAGVLVDADSTPTVAVRKNGAATADSVTVTKRAATTGIYDCSYNPAGEVEGDSYTLEETATISSQVYVNAWSLGVRNANFDPAADTVANVTTVATCTTNTDMRGTNQADLITPDNAGIAANGVAIASLNDFDPAADTVANVTLVDTTTTNTDMRGTDGANTVTPNTVAPDNAGITANGTAIAALNDFDPASDTVANVTTVATNTDMRGTDGANTVTPNTVAPDNASITAILADTNELQSNQGDWATATTTVASNMRGTDNALLASSAPSNWSTLIIGTGVDAGKVTTSNPASGGGSNHTAQDVADLILTTPANKLATDSSGDVSAHNMRGTDGANTVAPDNAGIAANGVAITSLNDFDPAADTVANVTNVTTVGTCTTNTDMRGTDGANTVAPDNADISAIKTKTDQLSFTVANQVDSNALTGGGGDDAATIYTYFTGSNREDQFKADVSGLATSASITALNDFDPAADTVANVTTVAACTTNSDMRGTDGANTVTPNTVAPDNASITSILADTNELQLNQGNWLTATTTVASNMRGTDGANTVVPNNAGITSNGNAIAALNDFDPAVDTVANVTLVGTTTTNTDMRGTDDANTIAPVDVSGDVSAIKTKTDQLVFTVANQVDSNALSGGGGDDSATIYTYFTSLSRQDTFKADISTLSTSAEVLGLNDFDPATDTVVNVGTVSTVVTNTDMRGTDNALLAASTPTNFEDLTITPSTGKITVGTNDDKSDYTISGTKTTLDSLNDISVADILSSGDVDGFSLEETLKLCLSALAGKLSGAGTTTIAIRAADDSKDRITAVVDINGNRSAVTLDVAD